MSLAILPADDGAVVRATNRRSLALGGVPVGRVGEASDGRAAVEHHLDLPEAVA